MSQISLTGITKSFGDTRVLNGISLDIADGEFVTLVGPSGCGKSTLLRILAGLEAPDAGSVTIAERDVTAIRPAERNLAMVFQSYALYPHLTVEQNMLTPLRLRDLSRAQRLPILGPLLARAEYRDLKDQVRKTAQILQMDHLLDRKPGQLSGGQRQRAALGRAMVRKPVAFLMDEPLSNLDAALRVHMRAELSDLHRQLAKTFVYVTHDQAEALTMSDRMAVMMSGNILQFDTPAEVYTNPASLEVAKFVGSPQINTLPGEVDGAGHASFLNLRLARALAAPEGPVTIGIRPEHLRLAEAPHEGTIAATVTHKENLGSDTYLHLATQDGAHRLTLRTESRLAAEIALQSTVHAALERGQALAFAADGARLHFAEEAREAIPA